MKVEATVADNCEEKKEINLIFTNKSLGEGACGKVLEAKLEETGEMVALKVTKTTDDKIAEVEYLKTLKHCNIVSMLYHFRTCRDSTVYGCIVMERMPMSLWDIYDIPEKLPLFELKLYMYQLLRSVAYIHKQGICHRDIKPANVLINPQTSVVKLCDFGLAKDLSLQEENSTRIGTRTYHAPERLLGCRNYTNSVDVWAVGCIFVELWKGQTELFTLERTVAKQLAQMMGVFGTPTAVEFPGMKPFYPFDGLAIREALPWMEISFPYPMSDEAISLCSGLLCYSPSCRLLPHEALAHKFFDELRSPETTRLANGNPLPPLFNFQPGEFPEGFDHLIPPHLNRTEKEKID